MRIISRWQGEQWAKAASPVSSLGYYDRISLQQQAWGRYHPLEQLVVSVSLSCWHLLSLVLMTGDDTTYVSAWQKTDVWWEQCQDWQSVAVWGPNRDGGMMRAVNPCWSDSRNQERREHKRKIWMPKIKWRLFCSKSPVYCLQNENKVTFCLQPLSSEA